MRRSFYDNASEIAARRARKDGVGHHADGRLDVGRVDGRRPHLDEHVPLALAGEPARLDGRLDARRVRRLLAQTQASRLDPGNRSCAPRLLSHAHGAPLPFRFYKARPPSTTMVVPVEKPRWVAQATIAAAISSAVAMRLSGVETDTLSLKSGPRPGTNPVSTT